jgi:hypothetical protein
MYGRQFPIVSNALARVVSQSMEGGRMSNKAVPFGLLFQEAAVDAGEVPVPVYDEAQDVSVVEQDGDLVPFATAVPAAMATHTETKAWGESADQDIDPATPRWSLGTFTETKAMGEQTDQD